MLRKYASLQVLEAWSVPAQAGPAGLVKAAHRVAFHYEPREGYLYVRSRMISSRTNDNHDTFPADEIEKGYKSFLGKPVFVNHHNANHRRARGVIVAVALHRDRNADGTPDTWVEGLMEVDAVRFPKLAKAILAGKVNRTSMGVDVEWSTCSACGNKATSPAEYCSHLPAMKGKKIRKRNQATGKIEEKLIHEVCAGLSFFENSLLVEDPADPTAYVLGDVDARGLGKAASKRTAAADPDFHDHIANPCTACGVPVDYNRGADMRGRYPWKHATPLAEDHQAAPKFPQTKTRHWPLTFGGTHCLACGEPAQVYLGALDRHNGGWSHGDGMKRDHPAIPADPQAVYDSIPGVKAQYDQARSQMSDRLHSQFEQLSGGPLPRALRGDEDQMPPDPFTASRTAAKKREGGDHPFFADHPVSHEHVVHAYHDSTEDEKALGGRWYSDAHHVAKAIAGGDAAVGAGLLSAYSPQTAWPVNMFNASRAAQGDPPGPGTGAMGMQQKSAMRILAGEHHSKVLKAPKTAAFARLIEHGGDTPEEEAAGKHNVVVDRHALSVAVGHRVTKEEGQKAPLDQGQHYEHVAQAYRTAAHVLSQHYGRKITPHEVQAATWLRQVRKNQEEDRSGAKGPGGKGRVTMHDNSRTRWENHHQHHHPGGIAEDNMHYHGSREAAWRAFPENCVGCGSELEPGVRNGALRFLCVGCAGKTVPYPDHQENPDLAGGGRRRFTEGDYLPPSLSLRRTAYGETRVPPQVDTLRMEECPVCGEHDVWSGNRCPVCGFVVPPSLFRDPDTSKAQQVRDQLDQSGEVTTQGDGMQQQAPGTGPDGQIGSGDDADEQLVHPDQVTPDGVPAVQGEQPQDTDGQPPAGGEPAEDEDPELAPGEEPEDDGAGTGDEEIAEGQQMQEQGSEEEAEGQQAQAEGQELVEQGQEDELEPQEPEDDLECPACGARFATDGAAQPGVPCPACRMAALVPLEAPGGGMDGEGFPPGGLEDEEDEEAGEGEEPGGPQKEQEDPSESGQDEGEEKMSGSSKTGAAVTAATNNARIAALTAENEVLREQLRFLASAAGADRYLEQIRVQVMKRHADILNPGSPVPDPPQGPPSQTTQEALQSGSYAPGGHSGTPPRGTGHTVDDPSRPGATPGSMVNVPAAQTTTAITPGVEMQTPPATNLIDVTAPVQGTNPSQDGGVPVEQRRIETDVRIDPDPLKAHGPGIGGAGDNGTSFPWMLDARQPGQNGQQKAASRQDNSAERTFASIRLAKMRITAGLAQGDELAVAASIERDGELSMPMIEREITVLSSVRQQAPQQRPMHREGTRQAPSLASVGAASQYASAASMDDLDGSDIFL